MSGLLQRLRLRHAVFAALLLAGILPLALSSLLLIWQNRQLLEEQEEEQLLRAASSLSSELDSSLASLRSQLEQLGGQLLVNSNGRGDARRELRKPEVGSLLEWLLGKNLDLIALQVLAPPEGEGPRMRRRVLFEEESLALNLAFERARSSGEVAYQFLMLPETEEPAVALAVPASTNGKPRFIVQGLAHLPLLDSVFRRQAVGEVEIFLLDPKDGMLWSAGGSLRGAEPPRAPRAVLDLGRMPFSMITAYEDADGDRVLARVSPVGESRWSVVVQRPAATAFEAVDRMVFNTLLSSLLLVVLALLFALLAARRVSQSVRELAETTHEIASGKFGRRVDVSGLLFELADLGEDFNRMSGHVERYIQQLRRAAQENRDLFIGSLRAFAAAIDAKDPYTRGHSERVATVSRTLARYLGLSEEMQERLWIAALLHDVGKIGVEDRVLQKVGRLEPEELAQVQQHPVIGVEILTPIEQLKEMLPAVRWHHENWNGRGYPDGIKGEEIPLMARIVAVADTFDAVTTNRPYQQAYTLEFAVETLTRLTGSRFDAKVVTAFLSAYEKGQIKVAPAASRGGVRGRSLSEVEARVLTMS